MRKPAWMFKNVTTNRLRYSHILLWRAVDVADIPEERRRVLRAAAWGGEGAMSILAAVVRKGSRSGLERAFQIAIDDDDGLQRAHRVATYAVLGNRISRDYPDLLEEVMANADEAWSFRSDAERRVAFYGPYDGIARITEPQFHRAEPNVDSATQFARFLNRALEAVFEAALQHPVAPRSIDGGLALGAWPAAWETATEIFFEYIEDPSNEPLPTSE